MPLPGSDGRSFGSGIDEHTARRNDCRVVIVWQSNLLLPVDLHDLNAGWRFESGRSCANAIVEQTIVPLKKVADKAKRNMGMRGPPCN
jgi:hypothetical protein